MIGGGRPRSLAPLQTLVENIAPTRLPGNSMIILLLAPSNVPSRCRSKQLRPCSSDEAGDGFHFDAAAWPLCNGDDHGFRLHTVHHLGGDPIDATVMRSAACAAATRSSDVGLNTTASTPPARGRLVRSRTRRQPTRSERPLNASAIRIQSLPTRSRFLRPRACARLNCSACNGTTLTSPAARCTSRRRSRMLERVASCCQQREVVCCRRAVAAGTRTSR